MRIYIVNIDTGVITERFYDNILNLEQFKRDLDEIYPDCWYDNVEDALDNLEDSLI